MHIAVVSDMHMGRGDQSDMFMHDDREFAGFLIFLENNFDKIVLLGDIFETLYSPLFDPAAEYQACCRRHKEVSSRFAGGKYLYIHGNHDFILSERGIKDVFILDADGIRILFTHGHQFSRLTYDRSGLTKMCAWMAGWGKRCGFSRTMSVMENRLYRSFGIAGDDRKFQKWAIKTCRKSKCDMVVTGHTHISAYSSHDDGIYMNSGHCSRGQLCFLGIDTANLRFSINHSY